MNQLQSGASSLEGGCDCRNVRYRLTHMPLFDHCCHCRWCQRESGSSFALNALIETDCVSVLCGDPVPVTTPFHQFEAAVGDPTLGRPHGRGVFDRKQFWPTASLERRRLLMG